jgi:Secretion system C-terminal sorting domain
MHTYCKKINGVIALAYSNINKLFVCIVVLFISINVNGQIPSTVANSLFTLPATNPIFTMPTATDVVSINGGLPLQVMVSNTQTSLATSGTPRFHYNYNGSILNSLQLPTFGTYTVLADDVALAQNGNYIVALVTCRVFNTANNTIDIYLARSKWEPLNGFAGFLVTYIASRPYTATDNPFDRVSIEAPKNLLYTTTPYAFIDVVWQQAGNIYVRKSSINFLTGSISTATNTLLFQANSVQYPGTFSCPDVVRMTNDHRTISVLYKNANTQSVLITMDEDLLSPGLGIYNTDVLIAYTTSNTSKLIRTPRIDMPAKYYYAVCFNEYDISTKKSNIIVVANPQGATPTVLPVINSELENMCTNNTNYKLTGFPNIKFTTPPDVGNAQSNYVFEVAWQQVACTGSSVCTINAIAKRFAWSSTALTITQPAPIGNQYLHINQALTLNSFFPSIAALSNSCQNFYAFGIMDKTTSANGKIGYKKTTCSANSLRQLPTVAVVNNKQQQVYTYPNPVQDALIIQLNDVTIKTYQIQLINTQGLVVKEYKTQASNTITIAVNNIPAGNYVLKIATNNQPIITKKVMVQHPY